MDWVTPNQLAMMLRVHHSTVRSWIAKGELAAHRVGVRIRIPRYAANEKLRQAGVPLLAEAEGAPDARLAQAS